MSWFPTPEPLCTEPSDVPALERVIEARARSIGAFSVGRLLPSAARRTVGPFIFFDHMGPAELAPGHGADVPPHPHIGLATVTYLFEGALLHRDSLGTEQRITPGAVNWMRAGRGIAHSERTPPELRAAGARLHGLQLWVALPREQEEAEPEFQHHPAEALPALEREGVRLRVLAGAAYGAASPVRVSSPLFYVEARLPAGARLALPTEHAERAVYVVAGALGCGPEHHGPGRMLVFRPDVPVTLRAEAETHCVLLGGAPLGEPRHIYWNFVSSSRERIEQAKRDWKEGRFPRIPGDDREFVPLPE